MAESFEEPNEARQGCSRRRTPGADLARRADARAVNSDHLTVLGSRCSWWRVVRFLASRCSRRCRWVVIWLALNWFGDSLDGTLARVRGHQRPATASTSTTFRRFGALFVLGGLALSGYMTPLVAAAFLSPTSSLIEIYLATYCVGTISDVVLGMGTDRAANPARHRRPRAAREADRHDCGSALPLFDVGGHVAAVADCVVTAFVGDGSRTRGPVRG